MLLSDVDIKDALAAGKIKITPEVREPDIRPTGIRVHMAAIVAYPEVNGGVVELSDLDNSHYRRVKLGPEGFTLRRGQFVLASTAERISTTPDIIAQLDGRSTLARLGIMVHCGSMVIDNIHDELRAITLEMINLGPYDVRLRAGDSIGMVFFSPLRNAIAQAPSEQYRGQIQVTPPSLLKAC
jgi:dCTP deaminase